MEQNNNKTGSHVDGCKCMGCDWKSHAGCCGRFSILRVIIALIILGFVFVAGVHIGRWNDEDHMMGGHEWERGYNQEGRMMQDKYQTQVAAPTSAPALPVATSTAR